MSVPARPVLPAPFDVLANAASVSLGRVGYAAVLPPEAIAYEQARRLAGSALPELERLLAHGTPAGRMYAAMLLDLTDRDRGRRAWESLRSVHARVSVAPGGCVMYSALVSDFAESVLTRGVLEAYRPLPLPGPAPPDPAPAAADARGPGRIERWSRGVVELVGSAGRLWTRLQRSPGGAVLIAVVSVSAFIGAGYLVSALLAAE
ncbi:hypothetical protein BE08_07395 [Sorangium cellulosum]|uniref:Uncharacterized protein n=1 Tax=Sorangium cellulosum TaxID=56 RepID=A0A150PUE3_SORCE|nr:hypothetical protein BE08_07395 [Sorangium cellulosum]